MKEVLMVGIGGFAGSVVRYWISAAMLPGLLPYGIPWHTLLINVAGSLLIGVIFALKLPSGWQLMGAMGFCGGFTTFSTFSLELMRLLKNSHYTTAGAYLTMSFLLSIMAVGVGYYLGRQITYN